MRRRVIGQEKVCGAVNARNRMGGYNGPAGFLYSDGAAQVADQDVMNTLGLVRVL